MSTDTPESIFDHSSHSLGNESMGHRTALAYQNMREQCQQTARLPIYSLDRPLVIWSLRCLGIHPFRSPKRTGPQHTVGPDNSLKPKLDRRNRRKGLLLLTDIARPAIEHLQY